MVVDLGPHRITGDIATIAPKHTNNTLWGDFESEVRAPRKMEVQVETLVRVPEHWCQCHFQTQY